jgi:hypothetical protein
VSPDATALEGAQADRAAAIISTVADEAGARRPTSRSERIAAEVVGEALRGAGAGSAPRAVRRPDAHTLAGAVAVGREMIALIDRGRAD